MEEHVNGTVQKGCIPSDLSGMISIAEFAAYESDWPATNRRRGELIDKEIKGTITSAEAAELAGLQAYADYYLEKTSPRPTQLLEDLEKCVFGTSEGTLCSLLLRRAAANSIPS